MCYLNFIGFLLFLWNFQKFFPQFIQNSTFSEYFFKIFTLKTCLNIARKCYECTKNVLRISYKFSINLRTVHKISSKRLEYLINFLGISFSKIFRTFPYNSAKIFKASFKLYSQNFYINTLIRWKFHKLYKNFNIKI